MRLPQPGWSEVPRHGEMPDAALQIWRLRLSDLAPDPLETLRPLTAPAEHDRALHFQFEADRHRHLAGRGLLRVLLASRYGGAPRSIPITENSEGKPRLDIPPHAEPRPHFNIAHAADVVVVALSWNRPVGIDIEPRGRINDSADLAQRVLTESEFRCWQSVPDAERADFFLHVWTCKEAFLKATGTGLRRGTNTIECRFDGAVAVGIDDAAGYEPETPGPSASSWALEGFDVTEDVIGTVVREHGLPSSILFADGLGLVEAPSPS